MIPIESFTTERTRAERIREGDLPYLLRLNSDERVMATLGGAREESAVRAFLAAALEHWERFGYGVWIIKSRSDGEFIGRMGLRRVQIENTTETELMYASMPPYWRGGITTEVSRRILELARESLPLETIVAFTLPDNLGSRRVMEKCGFIYERDFTWAGLASVLYRIRLRASPS